MDLKVLTRRDVAAALTMPAVLGCVRDAYTRKAQGQTAVWPSVEFHFPEDLGVMDIRSGYLGGTELHGAKLLNNFPGNAESGLPTLTGLLMVFDSTTGLPLAVMDASRITSMRTGAAAGLGAAALARPDSHTLLLVGTGYQALFTLAGVLVAMPRVNRVLVCDPLDPAREQPFSASAAARLSAELALTDLGTIEVLPCGGLERGLAEADLVVTVTRATEPFIPARWVRPGTHLSCIGADMHGKQELDPQLFRYARTFVDDLHQCMSFGELELATTLGIMTAETVAGELGEVLGGTKPGRLSPEDITVFDATGLALLDIATAGVVLQQVDAAGGGRTISIWA